MKTQRDEVPRHTVCIGAGNGSPVFLLNAFTARLAFIFVPAVFSLLRPDSSLAQAATGLGLSEPGLLRVRPDFPLAGLLTAVAADTFSAAFLLQRHKMIP